MSDKIIDIPAGDLLESGLFPGMHPLAAPLWVDGRNIEFMAKHVHKAKGWSEPQFTTSLFDDGSGNFDDAPGMFDAGAPVASFSTPSSGPIRGIHQQRLADGTQELFFADLTKIYLSTAGPGATKGTGYTGTEDQSATARATLWSSAPWGDWTLFTNGYDAVQIYKGLSFGNLTGATMTAAEIIVPFGPHMIAINTDNIGPRGYEFSAAGNVEQWDPSTYATAGNNYIREATGDLIAAAFIGNNLGIFTKEQLFLLSYLGAPFFFGHHTALSGIGARSKKSVVSTGEKAYGWGPDGIYVTDGSSFQYIDNPAVKEWLEDNLNESQDSKIVGFYNEKQQRVIWYFPSSASTENDTGIGYNIVNNSWTIYNYGRTAAVGRDVFDGPMTGADDGSIFQHEYGVNANGAALLSWIQTKPMDAGDPNMWKYVDAIRIMLHDIAGTGVQYKIGTQEKAGDSITWGSLMDAEDGFEPEFDRISGVLISFMLYSYTVDDDWHLSGLQMLGGPDGGAL